MYTLHIHILNNFISKSVFRFNYEYDYIKKISDFKIQTYLHDCSTTFIELNTA